MFSNGNILKNRKGAFSHEEAPFSLPLTALHVLLPFLHHFGFVYVELRTVLLTRLALDVTNDLF
jgi:hypothetical protein